MAQYRAFISYGHDADSHLAPALHSGLRRIGMPWYRLPFRVFLDRSTMSPPVFWPAIQEALANSDYLVLLASPDSAQSEWVTKEVRWWLDNRSTDRLIIVLTDGEISWDSPGEDFDWTRTTALSPSIGGCVKSEPLFVDLRWARTERTFSPRQTRFRDAILDIASTLHGVSRDALDDRDVRHSRIARRLAAGAVIGLAGLTITTGIAAYAARNARLAEQSQRERAEQAAIEAQSQRDAAELRRAEAEEARRREAVERDKAMTAAAEATKQRKVAVLQRDLALCRQLASKALTQLDQRLDLALLVAVEGHGQYDCPEISSALLAAVNHHPRLIGFLSVPRASRWRGLSLGNVTSGVAFSADGRLLVASGSLGGQMWDIATRAPIGGPLEANSRPVFTPDGKTVVASDVAESIHFWDTATGTNRGTLRAGRPSIVKAVEISPDAKLVAAATTALGGERSSVYLWDTATMQPVGSPLPADRHAFSPDWKTIAINDINDVRRIVLWDVATRTRRAAPLEGHAAPIDRLTFAPDGRLLASGDSEGAVFMWDLSTRVARSFGGHFDNVTELVFSPDGRLLASADEQGVVFVWDVGKGTGQRLTSHAGAVHDVVFSHDGRLLATAGADRQVMLWDTKTLLPRGAPLSAASGPVFSLAFSADDRMLASTSGDERVILWSLESDLQLGRAFTIPRTRQSNVAFSRDGRTVTFVDSFGGIVLWDLKTAESRMRFESKTTALDISADGKYLAAVSTDGYLSVYDVSTPQPFGSRFQLGNRPLWSVRFAPDAQTIAVGGASALLMWDVRTRKVIGPVRRTQTDRIWSLAFSPDGRVLVSGGDQSVRVWNVKDRWTSSAISVGSPDGLSRADVTFSPDGRLLAFRDGDSSVAIWDVRQRRRTGHVLTRERGRVSSFAFSPDGEVLAIGAGDGRLTLWDVESGESLGRPLSGHDAEVEAVAFGPDGRTLVSVGGQKLIVWDFRPEFWVTTGCRMAHRNLTEAEWTRHFGQTPYRPSCHF